jgi:hypothetical protein
LASVPCVVEKGKRKKRSSDVLKSLLELKFMKKKGGIDQNNQILSQTNLKKSLLPERRKKTHQK